MSLTDDPKELIEWYEGKDRVLTADFIAGIPWDKVKDSELGAQFIPVITYMRDVEKFTEVYYKELLMTPTGRDPILRHFIDRWSVEEQTHADLLNRFLEESNIPVEDKWFEKAKKKIPYSYRISSTIQSLVTNAFGKSFSAVHMTWGAINELTTLHGYRRLWEQSGHPVLEYILRHIAQEEAVHAFFYSTLARIELQRSRFAQQLTKYIVKNFWTPVGQGSKPAEDTNYVIKTLFEGSDGQKRIDTFVNQPIAQLPGLVGLTKISDTIGNISLGKAAT